MSVTHHLAPRHRPSCCWLFLAQPWTRSLPLKPSRTRGRGGNLAGPLGGAGGWFQATGHLPYSRHTQERGQEPAGPHPPGAACEEGPRAQGSEDVPRTVPSPTVGGSGRLCLHSCAAHTSAWLCAAWAPGRHQRPSQQTQSHFSALSLSQLVTSKTR